MSPMFAGVPMAVLSRIYSRRAARTGGPLEAVPAQTGVIGSEIHNQRVMVMNSVSSNASDRGGFSRRSQHLRIRLGARRRTLRRHRCTRSRRQQLVDRQTLHARPSFQGNEVAVHTARQPSARRAALVARRQDRRLHRRLDERPRLSWRRHLRRVLRWSSARSHSRA